MGEFVNDHEKQSVLLKTNNIDLDNPKENGEEKVTESVNSKPIISIASDFLSAKVELIAPKSGGQKPSEKDILDALTISGVVRGIKSEIVSRLAKHLIYERPFKIAQGVKPSTGQDGNLICHFNYENNLVPQVLEDGSVDYKNMGFGNDVKEGDLLCEIIEAVKGEDGFDVLGRTFVGENGKSVPPPNGTNTKLSEDGTKLYATCDGHVSIKDNKVSIRRVMVVEEVNKSTGNILFSGDVNVNGDVSDGFTIRAGGSITVKGVAENAILVAGRDITVSKGVKGKDSVISAGGSIRTGYIELAKVTAKECIYVDAVLNADIECGDKVILVGRRGCLIGGVCRVTKELQVKEIGNDANIFTEIIIVAPIVISEEKENVTMKIKECTEKVESFSEILHASTQSTMSSLEKQEAIAPVLLCKKEAEAELRALFAHLEEINANTEVEYEGRILLHGHMFPNVSLSIGGLKLKNTVTRPACTITRKKEDITFGAHIG
ncbi:MAG: FapA family protein [Oscillospiraceae bacterium]